MKTTRLRGKATRGRFPLSRKRPPPDLCYAVVIQEREGQHLVSVTTRLVYGTEQQLLTFLRMSPVSKVINTYGVERNNLTVRQHSRRLGRKVNAFSKKRIYLNYQLALAFAYYHFCCPHRGLRHARRPTHSAARSGAWAKLDSPLPTKKGHGSPKKWRPVTPATLAPHCAPRRAGVAAGLTDHVWTIDELLSFRVPPRSRWK